MMGKEEGVGGVRAVRGGSRRGGCWEISRIQSGFCRVSQGRGWKTILERMKSEVSGKRPELWQRTWR